MICIKVMNTKVVTSLLCGVMQWEEKRETKKLRNIINFLVIIVLKEKIKTFLTKILVIVIHIIHVLPIQYFTETVFTKLLWNIVGLMAVNLISLNLKVLIFVVADLKGLILKM
mgnify:CR=1 FL=1